MNLFKYLKNPISIMLLGTLFVTYVLPKMTEGVDMESLREEQGSSGKLMVEGSSFDDI